MASRDLCPDVDAAANDAVSGQMMTMSVTSDNDADAPRHRHSVSYKSRGVGGLAEPHYGGYGSIPTLSTLSIPSSSIPVDSQPKEGDKDRLDVIRRTATSLKAILGELTSQIYLLIVIFPYND